jgi:hypothetical protein
MALRFSGNGCKLLFQKELQAKGSPVWRAFFIVKISNNKIVFYLECATILLNTDCA